MRGFICYNVFMNPIEKLYNEWFSLPAKTRFFVAGFGNFIVSILLFAFLVTILGYRHYRICVFLQWFLPSLVVYLIQKYFVFKTKGDVIYEYLKYSAVWFFCFILNVAILEFIVMLITKNVYSAQLFAYIIVFVISYFIYKNMAFVQKK